MSKRVERQASELLRGRVAQSICDPTMRHFMKNHRYENGEGPDYDLTDDLFQERLGRKPIYEYGKDRQKTRRTKIVEN